MQDDSKVTILKPADCSGQGRAYWRSQVAAVSIEYANWKKTQDFQRWRAAQWFRQDAKCYYCLCDLRTARVNVEHIVPRSRGGTNRKSNLVLSCATCNRNKGSRTLKRTKKRELRERFAGVHKRSVKEAKKMRLYQERLAAELRWITDETAID